LFFERTLGLCCMLLLGLAAGPTGAYDVVGPARCTSCHHHARQTSQWRSVEPASLNTRAHFYSLKLLEAPEAARFARALGLSDPYERQGACVGCHATSVRGDATAGVSCESCHGAASGYLVVHQVAGSYGRALSAGMRELRGQPQAIARLCVDCHSVTDSRLTSAGHPSGAEFEAGSALGKLVHWSAAYDFAEIGRLARAAIGRRPPAPEAAVGTARPEPAWEWDSFRPLPADYATRKPEPARAKPAPPNRPVRSASARAAEIRGEAILMLESLLRGRNAPVTDMPPPPGLLEYEGPEGELHRIQDEALALAVEALGALKTLGARGPRRP